MGFRNDMRSHGPPSFIDARTARRLIGDPMLSDFVTCYDVAWELFNTEARKLAPSAHPRSVAAWYREMVLDQIRQRIVGQPGVKVNEVHDRFLLEIQERVLVQFKRLRQGFTTSNIPTETARRFDSQYEMEGIRLPRVTVGYQPDPFWFEIDGVYLVFNIGKTNIWFHDLRTGEDSAPPLPFPTPSEGAAAREAREQAQQKERDAEKKSSESDPEAS